MRVIESRAVVLMNPEDAAAHPDGMFGGHPIVADPDAQPGFVQFKVELPPEVSAPEPDVLYVVNTAWME